MRLSANQKDVLYALEHKGRTSPLANTQLLRMINQSRSTSIHASNLRQSCHTLHRHSLLAKYYNPSQQLAWQLTEVGHSTAKNLYEQRMK